VKKFIGAILVLGLIIGGVYTINNNNNEIQTASAADPGGGGH
jgi:hypothetical protein